MTATKLYGSYPWKITIGSGVLLIVLFQSHYMTFVREHVNLLVANDIPRRWMYYLSFAIILLLTVVSYLIPNFRTPLKYEGNPTSAVLQATSDHNKPSIKVIAINNIDWDVLYSTLKSYRSETNLALEHLSMMLEVVESEERGRESTSSSWKLSNHVRQKMMHLAKLYDEDMYMLENELLLPFPVIHALPDNRISTPASMIDVRDDADIADTAKLRIETNFTWWSEKSASNSASSKIEIYDSIRQVIAHLVRDWSSSEGAPIRRSIYDWCIKQLELYRYEQANGPIFIPGAGLGRLAWEISHNLRCAVEAMESSVCMTAAAHSILNVKWKNSFVLHPFAADSFSNEIDDEARYDTIYFPDVNPSDNVATVSYTVGTFGIESMQHCSQQYGAVVTSFFIDTATTVYDFITTIAMILSFGGLWINVGPLQWHINNKVPVAVNELRMILENFRDPTSGKHLFQILHWSVDINPIRYRNHGGRKRSTYYDGYCPLRFVIRRNAT